MELILLSAGTPLAWLLGTRLTYGFIVRTGKLCYVYKRTDYRTGEKTEDPATAVTLRRRLGVAAFWPFTATGYGLYLAITKGWGK